MWSKAKLTRGYPESSLANQAVRFLNISAFEERFLAPVKLFHPPSTTSSFDSWGGWRPTTEIPPQPDSRCASRRVSSLSVLHLGSGSVSRTAPAARGYREVILKHTATFHQQSNSPFQTLSNSHYYSMTHSGISAEFTEPFLSCPTTLEFLSALQNTEALWSGVKIHRDTPPERYIYCLLCYYHGSSFVLCCIFCHARSVSSHQHTDWLIKHWLGAKAVQMNREKHSQTGR